MTASTIILAAGGGPVDDVSAAIGSWCRRTPEKELARTFGVALQTAKKWRAGREMPAGRHLVAMAATWGQPFIDQVFASVIDDITLDRRLEALEASFALIRQDLRHDAAQQAAPDASQVAGESAGWTAPDAGRMACACRQAMAKARPLIVGIIIGAGAWHMVPHVPATVADLTAEASDWMRPKPPRGGGARKVSRTTATRSGREDA